jgi:hypothetical protein
MDKTPFEVTAHDVESGLLDLAKERPGVYRRQDGTDWGCVNIELIDGVRQPSCIVGSYYASRVGIDAVEASGNALSTTEALVEKGLITITPEALYMLEVAQTLQDSRKVEWEVIADFIFGLKQTALRLHEGLNSEQ